MVEHCVAVGAAPLGAMALALNHLQRQAILDNPASGLSLARQIAMISYKSSDLFAERYGRNPNRNGEDPHRSLADRYNIGGYLNYQGDIFTKRFDPDAYLIITKLMDNFDPQIGYDTLQAALSRITARILMIGIESDWLFPPEDVEALAARMKAANVAVEYAKLITTHGHDGFLAEPEQFVPAVRKFLQA